jgi:hypothetical protein
MEALVCVMRRHHSKWGSGELDADDLESPVLLPDCGH